MSKFLYMVQCVNTVQGYIVKQEVDSGLPLVD